MPTPSLSIIPSMVPQHNLVSKKTKLETKQRDRETKKKISAYITHQLGENATMILLAEGESLSSYKRKRLGMSFEEGPVKKPKSHSPTLDNQAWNHDQAIALLRAHPSDQKINWSQAARTLGIPNKNGGQVLKDFAKNERFDVLALECLTSPPTRKRRQKKKLPGGEISSPALPTPTAISEEKRALVASGKLSIGEPCSPYVLMKYAVTNEGEVVTKQVELHGRKIHSPTAGVYSFSCLDYLRPSCVLQ